MPFTIFENEIEVMRVADCALLLVDDCHNEWSIPTRRWVAVSGLGTLPRCIEYPTDYGDQYFQWEVEHPTLYSKSFLRKINAMARLGQLRNTMILDYHRVRELRILTYLSKNLVINAIKQYRMQTGGSLVEAKEACTAIAKSNGIICNLTHPIAL